MGVIELTKGMVAIAVGLVTLGSVLGGFLGAGVRNRWMLKEVYDEVFDRATGIKVWRAKTDVEIAEIKVRCETRHAED